MIKQCKMLFYTPFTGLGLHSGFRGNTWLRNRIKIFEEFTLRSIMNQSEKDWILWVSWRPEEKSNKLVQEFKKRLDGIRDLKFVFTYGGLCFYDDKYEDGEAKKRLLYNLHRTLPKLRKYVED